MTAIWSKDSPSWGSGLRIQRNMYALAVTLAMTGGREACPACDGPLDLPTAEVDRTVPDNDYCPGGVVYLCRACNQGRAALQSVGRDWTRADDYAADVARASESVPIPSVRTARKWWQDRREGPGSVSRYA